MLRRRIRGVRQRQLGAILHSIANRMHIAIASDKALSDKELSVQTALAEFGALRAEGSSSILDAMEYNCPSIDCDWSAF